jgi:hypothetical protein
MQQRSIGHPTEKKRTRNEEASMCPVCIVNTAAMVAGAGSTGGVLAVCIGKLRSLFRENHFGQSQKTKEK